MKSEFMKTSFLLILISIQITIISINQATALNKVSREDTVIFDAYGQITNPLNFNWMVPGTSRSHGMHQASSNCVQQELTPQPAPWLAQLGRIIKRSAILRR